MVARDVDDLCALIGLAKQFIKNFVDRFVPVPSLVQFPPVNHIPDKVERVRFSLAQKIKESGSIKIFGADVKIG